MGKPSPGSLPDNQAAVLTFDAHRLNLVLLLGVRLRRRKTGPGFSPTDLRGKFVKPRSTTERLIV